MAIEPEDGHEPRDYTKLIWGGILLVALLALAALAMSGAQTSTSTQVSARHILVKFDAADPAQRQRALDTVSKLRERIVAGEAFEKLAKDYSDDPQSGARGGYLGWTDKGMFEKAFEDYVWTAPIGELSPIVTTGYGFHLIQVIDRRYSEADRYEQELNEKVRQAPPNVKVNVPEGLPSAQPATGKTSAPAAATPAPAEPAVPAIAPPSASETPAPAAP